MRKNNTTQNSYQNKKNNTTQNYNLVSLFSCSSLWKRGRRTCSKRTTKRHNAFGDRHHRGHVIACRELSNIDIFFLLLGLISQIKGWFLLMGNCFRARSKVDTPLSSQPTPGTFFWASLLLIY